MNKPLSVIGAGAWGTALAIQAARAGNQVSLWARDPTAQVIHDAVYHDGRAVEIAPRQVLKRVIDLYREQDWSPVVAPERGAGAPSNTMRPADMPMIRRQ